MSKIVETIIEDELKQNKTFNEIFKNFEMPNIEGIGENLNLTYEADEYMGYYKKDLYYELKPKTEGSKMRGLLKLSFVSNTSSFDIQKAMSKKTPEDMNVVSTTFRIYNQENSWDSAKYIYTLWKNN